MNTGGVEVPDDGPCPGGGGATGIVVVTGGTIDSEGGTDVTAGIVVVTGTSDDAVGGALLGGGVNIRGA